MNEQKLLRSKNSRTRLVARLDVKGETLIKGVHLEGLRVLGAPEDFSREYYAQGADELIFMDIVASLYGRSNLLEIVERTAKEVFVPITVGGGVRSIEDVGKLLRSGADKIAINTAAVARPELISEVSEKFGSQCMVLSIEAKKMAPDSWEIYTDAGREKTGIDVIDWAVRGEASGAGEILVTSIDNEGTGRGFDNALIARISDAVNIPIIASGGFGEMHHVVEVLDAGADAAAFADAIHYQKTSLPQIRDYVHNSGYKVRQI
ncbi:imidazole glycerol phosphate synthase cyclase subunit [Alphaproteobacteria bacterium]|nr:imidazole glycerol phosphate synthase cyclase subunit [Alphaproteobacteria bacterium]